MSEHDVIVVGAGNAAFCAALAAQRAGRLGADARSARPGRGGRQQPLHRRLDAHASITASTTSRRSSRTSPRQEIAATDFGTYTQDQFFDDMARVTQYRADPDLVELLVTAQLRPAAAGCARRACASCRSMAARPSRSTASSSSGAGSPSSRWAAAPASSSAHSSRRAARHRGALRARAPLDLICRRRARRGRARAPGDGTIARTCAARGGARLRRLRGQPEWRTRYLGPGLGPRQGARHAASTPATASAWRSTIGASRARQLVGLPRGRLGHERARVRRPRGRRPVPEALLSLRHHGQRHGASASSTRAPTSATTPTPNTAASSSSSRGSSRGRSSTRR